ncbi:arylsulfatase B-like isoform X2 [Venturia canescens]|uniref:arylsulfatase B-like isoform X2 n=1 Tax=Venturia canescens TaxID=32260 RepID=UPI001C9C4C69|nr:arylsulfatase B-like isoform X2 [Venturia canescens]
MFQLCSRLVLGLLFIQLSEEIPSGPLPHLEALSKSPSEDTSKIFGHHHHKAKKPNIVVILADDLGWNDVSFHGADQIPTPNIDALAYNGVILNSHYVSALCTPSRSALMTGKYPIHTGMQHFVLLEAEPRGLPLKEKLLPQYMKAAGYKTHAIGKWHLGFYKREYTPTYRGFDSHFGYWNGLQDYYNHRVASYTHDYRGFDMRRNMSVAWDTEGKYSTDLFTEEAIRIIDEHDTRTPMFMYLAHLAPHSGNMDDPYQAPDEEIAKFAYIDDPERRIYAAMVSKLDASIGEVMTALRRRGMLDNSIIVFMSDNGAPTDGVHNNRGSNYPLRGMKMSAWEGGVRGVAAVWSPMIKNPRRVSNQLISITDWLPTFWSAAGMDVNDLGMIDGVDLWPSLISDKRVPRAEVLINIDDIENYGAIRRGDFKYVIGHTTSGDNWYGDSGRLGHRTTGEELPDEYAKRVLSSKAGVAISGLTTARQVRDLRQRRSQPSFNATSEFDTKILTTDDIRKLRLAATVGCNVKEEQKVACNPVESPCLFNIKEDPCEHINLAKKRPVILVTLEEALLKYRVTAIPEANVPEDPQGDPALWKGVWVSWRDANPWAVDKTEDNSTSRLPASPERFSTTSDGSRDDTNGR